MKVLTTLTSPYGRMVRALVIEKGFEDRVEIVPTVTRTPDTPVLDVNPSGRVPTLVTDDGTIFEESALICTYIDSLEDPQVLAPQTDWNARILEARARSMLDGMAVWAREVRRPENEQSPTIVAHETARGLRLAGVFDKLVADGAFDGPLDMAQLTLGCTLHGRSDGRPPGFDWRDNNPSLAAWVDRFGARPSMQETLPPG
jgi:glutathione S-transferase